MLWGLCWCVGVVLGFCGTGMWMWVCIFWVGRCGFVKGGGVAGVCCGWMWSVGVSGLSRWGGVVAGVKCGGSVVFWLVGVCLWVCGVGVVQFTC